NGRLKLPAPNAGDPLPLQPWTDAVGKRVQELSEMVDKADGGGKQTLTLVGTPVASPAAPDPNEKVAARFEFPRPPKGASQPESRAVEAEIGLPPLRNGLSSVALTDFPFPADIMKEYADDGVAHDAILKDKEKYAFRAAVIEAMDKVRTKWSQGAGA